MLITHDVLKRADAVKAKALDFLREEEPNLHERIKTTIEENARRLSDAIKSHASSNPLRIQDIYISGMKDIAGTVFFAEAIARDLLSSQKNKKLEQMVRNAYQDVSTVISNTHASEEKKDELEEAIKKVKGDNDSKEGNDDSPSE